jgi:hypothetical protein
MPPVPHEEGVPVPSSQDPSRNRSLGLVASSFVLPVAAAQSPQHTVVPAAYASTDAISYLWVPGASRDVRQQSLVGAGHLAPLLGRSITAIELRRSAAAEVYAGGLADLTVTLSITPARPLRCSRTFAANIGPAPAVVFQGQVALPTSPATSGPQVPWTPSNTVRIPLQTPFVYAGGTLCIDVVGNAVAGANANWWMADAMFEDVAGTIADAGDGCGMYGGPQGRWSFTATRKLVPGAHASFWAYGVASGLGIAVFGTRAPVPLPLTAIGWPAPGCHLLLGSLDVMLPAFFVPDSPHAWGRADLDLWIPDDAAMFGATLTTQWFDWSQMAVSNAVEWVVAGALPTLDMASIEGAAISPEGNVAVHLAHVLRFEHQ